MSSELETTEWTAEEEAVSAAFEGFVETATGTESPIAGTVLTVQAYRQVAGVTEDTEVLSPCGHEVPRFDQSTAFREFERLGVPPLYPRSRLCPVCTTEVRTTLLKKVEAPPQIASDWGKMSKQQREQAALLISRWFDTLADAAALADWKTLTPQQRGAIAWQAEQSAELFGLRFRELMSLSPRPTPLLTPAGLKRLKASPDVKGRRREELDRRSLQREGERKR